MQRFHTTPDSALARMLFVLVVSMLAGACVAPAPAPPRVDTSQLVAAGFKVIPATTAPQREHLRSLTPGTISAMERNDTPFYVYPDPANDRLYVGNRAAYQRYRSTLPPGTPSIDDRMQAQRAADARTYQKEDAKMRRADGRDLSDPFWMWPSFLELVW